MCCSISTETGHTAIILARQGRRTVRVNRALHGTTQIYALIAPVTGVLQYNKQCRVVPTLRSRKYKS